MFGLKFGVELEAIGIDKPTAYKKFGEIEGLTLEPVNSLGHMVVNFGNLPYRVKEDGSLKPIGCEVVSPILEQSTLHSLKPVIQHMVGMGLRCNKTCGLHVHIGVPDGLQVTKEHLDVLYDNWHLLSGTLWRNINPHPGRNREYAKLNFRRSQLGVVRKLAVNATEINHGKRTVEFRAFNGHLDFRYVCRAVRFAAAMSIACFEKIIFKETKIDFNGIERIVEAKLLKSSMNRSPASVG